MDFISTRRNLETIVRTMGTVTTEQLRMFFRNCKDAQNLNQYIREFIAMRLFEYDQTKDWVKWHEAPAVTEELTRRRIMAFWVVAYFGCENIREVQLLAYPSQLIFITTDNATYDLTVCFSETEAKATYRTLKLLQIPDGEDDVNHIAIVRDKKVGKVVLNVPGSPFDSYCIYDQNHIPEYYTE